MKKSNSQQDDNVRQLLHDLDRPVSVDRKTLAKEVITRVANRRAGLRRMATGSAILIAVVTISLPFTSVQETEIADVTASSDTAYLPETLLDLEDRMGELFDAEESVLAKQRLRELHQELSDLNTKLQHQRLVLAKEQLSRDVRRMVLNQIENNYPGFNGG